MPLKIKKSKFLSLQICFLWISLFLFLFPIHSLEARWYAPNILSGVAADEPQIASDLYGNTVVVWREFDGVNTSIRSYTEADGILTPTTTIATASEIYTQSNPCVTVDTTSTTFVVVWGEFNGSDYVVKSSTLVVGDVWTAPVDISTGSTDALLFPKVSACPLGYAVAVWQWYDGTSHIIQAATLTIGGAWSAPVNLTTNTIHAHFPQIKLTNSGDAVALWLDATNQAVQSATLPFEGSWSSVTTISAVGDANMPQLAANASGYIAAVWEEYNGSNVAIKSSTLQFGGSWSAPVEISQIAENAFGAQVAVDISGNIFAVWGQVSGVDLIIQAARLPFGGTWGIPEALSSTGVSSFDPYVAFTNSGDAFAVWSTDGDRLEVEASICSFGGSWLAPTKISESTSDSVSPSIAIAGIGESALVCWTDYTQRVIKATAWVPPPIVTSVSPDTGSFLGGETVTITGRGFVHVASVYFGSQPAFFVIDSPFQITATVPEGVLGTVNVVVTTLAGVAPITLDTQYTYELTAPDPTVTIVHPNHGQLAGGNMVKIIGSNFVSVTEVNFDSTPATSFTVLSTTVIIATVPSGSAGMVDVTVTTDFGTSVANVLDQYTYD